MDFTLYNGNKIPAIGVGTYLMQDEKVLTNILEEAFRIGYKLIDTAQVYKNEQFIGNIMANLSAYNLKREDIFLTTKLSPANQGRGNCKKTVLESLQRLQVDYIDLVLIHFPGTSHSSPNDPKNPERRQGSWEDLEELLTEGKIKNIGVSNYTIRHMEQLLGHAKIKPAVNQIEVHPLYYPKDLIDFCQKNSVVVQAYSSLGAKQGWPVLAKNLVLREIADKYHKTIPQILLRWALEHNLCVIPKTENVERLKENFQIFDFKITTEDMKKLDSLNQNHKFCWDSEKIF